VGAGQDGKSHFGFIVSGNSNVVISDLVVTFPADQPPLRLNYAFGQTGDQGDGFAANRGSVTDSWAQPSAHGGTLHRYALSN
ncbi:hypothetical protein DEM28_28680, partial [Enterobacter mori]